MKLSKYKFDIILSICVLTISIVLGLFLYTKKSNDLVAYITNCDNELVSYKLSNEDEKGREFKVKGIYSDLLVFIDNKGVEVLDSSCPHKDCINTGKITKNGQSIVCLYNKVSIELKNNSQEDIYL